MGGGGLSTNDPTVVAAFHRALLQGGMVVLGLLAALFVLWRLCRAVQLRRGPTSAPVPVRAEPAARRLLRVGFGLLWVFDGLLQGQSSMPLGLVPQVIQPAASTSPGWVQHLVASATSVWQYHPVTAAAATVWIQVGVGLFLLVSGRTEWSRLAGLAGAAWGLLVWIFGEAFGSVFAPGLTWMFGAPGAALFYVAGGALVALPLGAWASPRIGRWTLRVMGAFFAGMALLQAWPGRGFWQGRAAGPGQSGSLEAMVRQMAGTPQPGVLSSIVGAFADFDTAHGWAVNLFVVTVLALIGMAMLSGHPRAERIGVTAALVLCLADWLLVEDLGFMGGVGTDPNSMLPMALVLGAGLVAVVRVPARAEAAEEQGAAQPSGWARRLVAEPAYALRTSAAVAAVGVILVGAAPMAVAATNSRADPVLATAIAGAVSTTDTPSTDFQLTDQQGRPVRLADFRGKAVILTFLDPVCTTDCPVIARELSAADALLGADRSRVQMVAVNANPRFTALPFLQRFDLQEGLDRIGNWSYLTGPAPQLQAVWGDYGVDVEPGVGGAMMSHSDVALIIDPAGRVRQIIDTDPGPATGPTRSSFAQIFAHAAEQVLHR